MKLQERPCYFAFLLGSGLALTLLLATSGDTKPLSRKGDVIKNDLIPTPVWNTNCLNVTYNNVTNGYIYSPNYPADYNPSAQCMHTITANGGEHIAIAFYVLETEQNYDAVTLYDGLTIDDNSLIATLSGNLTDKAVFVTNSNVLTLTWVTDAFVQFRGFYAEFLVTNDLTFDPTKPACPDPFYTASVGVITSPHYPEQYPPSSNCSYQVGNGDPNTHIRFTVDNFYTEGQYDVLDIYDSDGTTLTIELSGQVFENSVYATTGPYAYAVFSSDLFTQYSGFSITYEIVSNTPQATTGIVPIDVHQHKGLVVGGREHHLHHQHEDEKDEK